MKKILTLCAVTVASARSLYALRTPSVQSGCRASA